MAGLAQTALTLWRGAEVLLARHRTDWTLFWRQLSSTERIEQRRAPILIQLIGAGILRGAGEALERGWARWLREWLGELERAHGPAGFDAADRQGHAP